VRTPQAPRRSLAEHSPDAPSFNDRPLLRNQLGVRSKVVLGCRCDVSLGSERELLARRCNLPLDVLLRLALRKDDRRSRKPGT
jgi:hypothetical protein